MSQGQQSQKAYELDDLIEQVKKDSKTNVLLQMKNYERMTSKKLLAEELSALLKEIDGLIKDMGTKTEHITPIDNSTEENIKKFNMIRKTKDWSMVYNAVNDYLNNNKDLQLKDLTDILDRLYSLFDIQLAN
ncbi:hypothetical protein TVAG_136730 [Trichomonas vaginalis G3]|uniref:Uncharacterized protein n=1 Tax=Trichomonas vaginalis (strain ATCC PRA-98 / G3) TaxID=412133 RepID=A2DJF5_TRIV3|nr:hypothetical protein TVAGG3_0543100 [Trichomonas vaginalis G3]EAY19542.1 hypothetical protein TVAG_136730 [Trichomonas vaginalis G3]KAI5519976.1 hypothetical protein TVAGG3_0543100 [Trichomonas vaginalis G3]|eukprot:XP_001580528.1 hypothetical protein [Trichomonas vaginalis G3]